jgi:hypothetical protein
MSHSATSLGAAFAETVTSKNYARGADLLQPDVDFRALTPNRSWQANDSDTVIEQVLTSWMEPDQHVEELISVDTDTIVDCERDGRIDWVRLVCSGSRPV